LSLSILSLVYYTTSYWMHHDQYWIKLDKESDHMPMVLLVQHKPSPLSNCQNNCNSYLYNTQRPTRLLLWLLLLPKCRKYTLCRRLTQRPTSSLKRRKNNERRVRGRKKPTDKAGEGTTEKWKARYPCNLCAEDHPTHQCPRLAEAQSLSHNNNKLC
jgi:ribosomal protein L44E